MDAASFQRRMQGTPGVDLPGRQSLLRGLGQELNITPVGSNRLLSSSGLAPSSSIGATALRTSLVSVDGNCIAEAVDV